MALSNTAQQVSGSTQPCGRPTQCTLLNELHEGYSKTPGGDWAPGSIFTYFIRTSHVKWQHVKHSISFETAASVLKHQGQCLAYNKTLSLGPPVPTWLRCGTGSVLPHTQEGPSNCK